MLLAVKSYEFIDVDIGILSLLYRCLSLITEEHL